MPIHPQRRGDTAREGRLADTGHVLEEEVPLGEEAGDGQGDSLTLALDKARDVVDDGLSVGRKSGRFLRGQGSLSTHSTTLGESATPDGGLGTFDPAPRT